MPKETIIEEVVDEAKIITDDVKTEVATIESTIEAWWAKYFHNSRVAGETELYNVLHAAKEELKTTLQTFNNKEI